MHPVERQLAELGRAFEPAVKHYLKARALHTAATLELKKAEDALFATGGGFVAALCTGFVGQPGFESAASAPAVHPAPINEEPLEPTLQDGPVIKDLVNEPRARGADYPEGAKLIQISGNFCRGEIAEGFPGGPFACEGESSQVLEILRARAAGNGA